MSDQARTREEAYLNLLHFGLVMVRDSAFGGHIELCQVEADHLHNIPSLIGEANESRHSYYIEHERGLYLERLHSMGATDYLEHVMIFYTESWQILADAAGLRLSE